MEFIKNYQNRKWIYSVFLAVLVVLGGYGIVDTVATQNLSNLAAAVLNLGGAGALALATRKAETVSSDLEDGDILVKVPAHAAEEIEISEE